MRWTTLAELATVHTTAPFARKLSNSPGSTRRQTAGRKPATQVLTNPPVKGGQCVPQPVPQVPVAEDDLSCVLPGSSDVFQFLPPVKPEIKVSLLKPALFYLSDGRIFYDKHLPDLSPSFESSISPHPRFSTEYFTALYSLVSAAGDSYPANTYNFRGARIPLAHTQLDIPSWKVLLEDYPNKSIVDKLEFGFPIGTSDEPELEPATKNHSSSYMYFSWLDKFCIKEIKHCGLTGPFGTVPFLNYHISPMMTSLKKPDKRRCVFDATFGVSLNKSTPKDLYLEQSTTTPALTTSRT